MRLHALAAPVLALLLAACAASTPDDPVSDDGPPPPSAAGEEAVLVIAEGEPGATGLTVSQALAHRPTDDLVSVSGALFVDAGGAMRLCEAIAESFPPQCGGPRLVVQGLDVGTVANLQSEGEVRWAESVVLFGSVE